ncbi:MAG: HD domain-containing protein [Bdellovibrionaceae bacterium]|nr:HD domain-containing protein [Pseudobdellovibrionaceae bacterium]
MSKTSSVITLLDDQTIYVPKDLFFEGMVLPVDIFIRMRRETYLLIGREGEKAKFSELHGFNHPNFAIFVRSDEHQKLISSMTEMTEKIIPHANVPLKIKAQFVTGLVTDAISSLEEKKFMTAGHLKKVAQLVVEMRQKSSVFDEVLAILQDSPKAASTQSMVTCLTSLALAEEMGITQMLVLEKISMGSLLHDIGLKFVPTEILEKPRHQWTPADLQVYENHPIQGIEMLRDLKDLPTDVLLIVAEHHENAQGTGFPKKLRDMRLSPLSRIVALATYFTDLLTSGRCTDADAAIEYMEKIAGQPFNRQVFSALRNIVNKRAMADQIKKAA